MVKTTQHIPRSCDAPCFPHETKHQTRAFLISPSKVPGTISHKLPRDPAVKLHAVVHLEWLNNNSLRVFKSVKMGEENPHSTWEGQVFYITQPFECNNINTGIACWATMGVDWDNATMNAQTASSPLTLVVWKEIGYIVLIGTLKHHNTWMGNVK